MYCLLCILWISVRIVVIAGLPANCYTLTFTWRINMFTMGMKADGQRKDGVEGSFISGTEKLGWGHAII